MSADAASGERLVHETTSLCRRCKTAVPARVTATPGGEVWMRKTCPEHGDQEVRLSTDAAWYEATRAMPQTRTPPPRTPAPVEHGCPYDCGPCESHTQRTRLPIVTITSACNLDCPICYVHNKNEDAFHISTEDFEATLDHVLADHGGELDILNLTGGDPTAHPRLLELLQTAQEREIHRVTICSNGVDLVRDEPLVKRLAELDVRVALSFDSFEREADYELQGARLVELKLRCLDLLEEHGVATTLIPVMTRGVNDHEIGRILRLGLDRSNIRHVEVHTITFTGQSGVDFERSGRISMVEVLRRIEETTEGLLTVDDFVPSPCAHPLCYQIAYLLVDPEGGPPVPFTRFMSRSSLHRALSDRLYLEPTPELEEEVQAAIDRVWSEGGVDSERILRMLKHLLRETFPTDRHLEPRQALLAAEKAVKAVYVHSHMDEETFDVERALDCCDANCYPDGSQIPICNYNVLFREKEASFNTEPRTWGERRGGVRPGAGGMVV